MVRKWVKPRSINRAKLSLEMIENALNDRASKERAVFYGYRELIRKRVRERFFHPSSMPQVLSLQDSVFGIQRFSREGEESIVSPHNLSNETQGVRLDLRKTGLLGASGLRDILSEIVFAVGRATSLSLEMCPYQTLWLKGEWGE